jgi:hypothetical protein
MSLAIDNKFSMGPRVLQRYKVVGQDTSWADRKARIVNSVPPVAVLGGALEFLELMELVDVSWVCKATRKIVAHADVWEPFALEDIVHSLALDDMLRVLDASGPIRQWTKGYFILQTMQFENAPDLEIRMLMYDTNTLGFFDKPGHDQMGTAAKVWPMAYDCCSYLASNTDLVRGKRVIELGAGIGMNSIVAARWADLTVATEQVERAQHVMKINAALNNVDPEVLQIDGFRFGREETKSWFGEFQQGHKQKSHKKFDVIIGR